MPATRLIALNGSGGVFTSILSSCFSRRVDVREDEVAGAPAQGLQAQKSDDNFVQVYSIAPPGAPDMPQLTLGNLVAHGRGSGPLLGGPAQGGAGAFNAIAATTLVKLRSRTAQPTNIRVTEHD